MDYPHVRHMGHRDTHGMFNSPCVVQEKIDGSQFRFMLDSGTLRFFSRSRERDPGETGGLFGPSMDHVRGIAGRLLPGHLYIGESVCQRKHNIISYERTPAGNTVLFDILAPGGGFYDYRDVENVALCLGLEPVRNIAVVNSENDARSILENGEASQLGGLREGVVVKNYSTGQMAKLVADQFQEVRGQKTPKPKRDTELDSLIARMAFRYGGPARCYKALQHLREDGKIADAPQDIGLLIKEVQADVAEECAEAIKDELWDLVGKKLLGALGSTTAIWYKELLCKRGGASEGFNGGGPSDPFRRDAAE